MIIEPLTIEPVNFYSFQLLCDLNSFIKELQFSDDQSTYISSDAIRYNIIIYDKKSQGVPPVSKAS